MRLRIKAQPGELTLKGEALVRAVAGALARENLELSDALLKAMPMLPKPHEHRVMREMHEACTVAYKKQMALMLGGIGKVLDEAVDGNARKSISEADQFRERVQAMYTAGFNCEQVNSMVGK